MISLKPFRALTLYSITLIRENTIPNLRSKAFNAIQIVGPKGCGKTRTAKERCKTIIKFEDEEL